MWVSTHSVFLIVFRKSMKAWGRQLIRTDTEAFVLYFRLQNKELEMRERLGDAGCASNMRVSKELLYEAISQRPPERIAGSSEA